MYYVLVIIRYLAITFISLAAGLTTTAIVFALLPLELETVSAPVLALFLMAGVAIALIVFWLLHRSKNDDGWFNALISELFSRF